MILPTVAGFCAFVFGGYGLSRIFRRNDIADVLWGLGFLLMAAFHLSDSETLGFRTQVMLGMLLLWSLRLSLYLGLRTSLKTEDIRYKTWRDQWGPREPVMAFLKVFLLQGSVLVFVSLPLILIAHSADHPVAPLDFLAGGLFLLGFAIETTGDWEMFRFKRDPGNKGKIITAGLWSLCRHPNYLGEILIWWGFGFLALQADFGAWALVSPILISFLLMKVSGVPMLEKRMQKESAEFRRYMESTPALFPWRGNKVIVFICVILAFILLDYLWLGLAMNGFYMNQAAHLVRLKGGDWDVLLWPALGVYICLALGVQNFAISTSAPQSFYRGFLLGFCIYGVYDLTNLSLLKDWPIQMSLIDLAWGPFLCGLAALVGHSVYRPTSIN